MQSALDCIVVCFKEFYLVKVLLKQAGLCSKYAVFSPRLFISIVYKQYSHEGSVGMGGKKWDLTRAEAQG